jgi:hypothetical protein
MKIQDQVSTMKVRKATVAKLRRISELRGRHETLEQVVLELVDRFMAGALNGK